MKKDVYLCNFLYICVNYVNMKIFLVRNLKTGRSRFNPGHWDSMPKTGTVLGKNRDSCNVCIIKYKNLLSYLKIGNKILTFGNIEIKKNNLYCYKSPIF